ncbi:MAG: CDP-glycerol glycerophosphotransferase family protein [Myxococcales bacterium]|nr:CDP-glycerol glycerophosphotransferase family protein [Myxococcales bacterium]
MKEKLRRDHPGLFSVLRRINGLRLAVLTPMQRARRQLQRRLMYRRVFQRRPQLLAQLRQRSVIRVAFVVIHRAVWKLDIVFQTMLADPRFAPFIVIAPDVSNDAAWTANEQERCRAFFAERQWPVHVGATEEGNGATLSELQPDIVFLTNPHRLTTSAFYDVALENFLTCYVPYSMDVSQYGDSQTQYNLPFHNAIWQIFAPHRVSRDTFTKVQDIGGKNVVLAGYPGIEPLVAATDDPVSPWKPQGQDKLKIIWAPHHTIDVPELPYANFLQYADLFQELVTKHEDTVQWCFKPHPILKAKLAKHPDWGPERTEAYYAFWQSHPSAQMELGGYTTLFRTSDAMIHDSGSFVAEFLYVDKPVMFLWSKPAVREFFNDYGKAALQGSERGDTATDITAFVDKLIAGADEGAAKRSAFRDAYPFLQGDRTPSQAIVDHLLSAWSSADR